MIGSSSYPCLKIFIVSAIGTPTETFRIQAVSGLAQNAHGTLLFIILRNFSIPEVSLVKMTSKS